MKKIFLVFVALVAAATMIAQNKVGIGLRAGVNFQNINGKYEDGDKMANRIITGLHGGIMAEIPVAVDFYIQPGVLYTQKGANLKSYEYMGQTWHGEVRAGYIEVPFNLLYKPVLGNGRLILGFGPYVAWGIGGEAETNGPTYKVKFKKDVTAADINETPFIYKPLDAGANFFAGYQFRKLSLQLNSQLGLTKINTSMDGNESNASHKHTGFGLSLGYRLTK